MMELRNLKEVIKTYPFTLQELDLFDPAKQKAPHPYYRLSCNDWVNIVPITSKNEIVMIRQFRVGTMSDVLETPGGVMEPGEKDPTMAAVRELEEETGYVSNRILPLAVINPNPAIMTNRLHMFVALNCSLNPQRQHFPDEFEKIEIVLTPYEQLDELIRLGRVNSCLAALAILLAQKYVKK